MYPRETTHGLHRNITSHPICGLLCDNCELDKSPRTPLMTPSQTRNVLFKGDSSIHCYYTSEFREAYLSLNDGEFIYLFGVLRCFQHCTGHIATGSWKGRGNQYIQFVRVLYCKLPTSGKQLPAFPLEAVPGTEPRPQRWEARVLPLCHRGPSMMVKSLLQVYPDGHLRTQSHPQMKDIRAHCEFQILLG